MKNLTLVLTAAALLAVSSSSFAQIKPEAGSFGTEVQFNPFDQKGQTFQLDGLKFRYFITKNDALRLKLGFGMNSAKFTDEDEGVYDESTMGGNVYDWKYKDEYKYKTGDFSLELGYERHFDIAKRLNLYVGGAVGISKHFVSTNIEGSTTVYKNGNKTTYTSSYSGKITNGGISSLDDINDDTDDPLDYVNDRANLGFNASVFTGLDFYVYKGLYVGTELGLRFKTYKTNKMKYTYETVEDHDITKEESESTNNVRYSNAGFYIEPVLRLGWTF